MADPEARISETEEKVALEAMRRGANVDRVVELLVARQAVPGLSGQLSGFVGDADARAVALAAPPRDPRPAVVELYRRYAAMTDAEFASVAADVRNSFAPDQGEQRTAQEKYREMRAAYYREGWLCAKKTIFEHIAPATFFGRPVIGGVHNAFRPLLSAVENHVARTNPAAARVMTDQAFSVGGFVPRFIAGQDELSNHAFGLALDLDPAWNPMVKGQAAIDAFRQGTGVTFGDWLYAASSVDELGETYKRVAAASERLKLWLRRELTEYNTEQELRQDLAKAKGTAAREAATARRRELDARAKADPDRKALDTLIKLYGKPAMRAWADFGIVTIPAAVVHAFVRGHPHARWGGQYRHSKDIMHLEVLAYRALRPGRTAPRRTLDDLLRGEPPPEVNCEGLSAPVPLQVPGREAAEPRPSR